MVGGGGDKYKVVRSWRVYFSINIVVCLSAYEEKHLAMIVNVVEVDALRGSFYSLV